MNAWVKKASPEIHKALKKQGKIITQEIQKQLEKHGVNKAIEDYSTLAGMILNNIQNNAWATTLAPVLQDLFMRIYLDAGQTAKNEVVQLRSGINQQATPELPQGDVSGSFVSDETFHDYANQYAKERTAQLVGKRVLPDGTIIDNPNPDYSLENSTRDMLKSDLINMMNEGLTPAEIASNLEGNYAFSETRSNMIARTETGFAWNNAAVQMYSDAGAKLVYVFDGDSDPDCEDADGQIWTIEYANDNPLGHPNCVRSFSVCLEPDAVPDRE